MLSSQVLRTGEGPNSRLCLRRGNSRSWRRKGVVQRTSPRSCRGCGLTGRWSQGCDQVCARPSRSNWTDHSAGASRKFATPMPRGSRPSTAALIRPGAINAIEMVMLTWRTLHLCRAAISSTVFVPETIASSHARPRAIDLSNAARRSNLIGRTCRRVDKTGNRISRNLLVGGLVQGIKNAGFPAMTKRWSSPASRIFSSEGLNQIASWSFRTSTREMFAKWVFAPLSLFSLGPCSAGRGAAQRPW